MSVNPAKLNTITRAELYNRGFAHGKSERDYQADLNAEAIGLIRQITDEAHGNQEPAFVDDAVRLILFQRDRATRLLTELLEAVGAHQRSDKMHSIQVNKKLYITADRIRKEVDANGRAETERSQSDVAGGQMAGKSEVRSAFATNSPPPTTGEGESERDDPSRCDTANTNLAPGNRAASAAPSPSVPPTCPECDGKGKYLHKPAPSFGPTRMIPCPTCHGSGIQERTPSELQESPNPGSSGPSAPEPEWCSNCMNTGYQGPGEPCKFCSDPPGEPEIDDKAMIRRMGLEIAELRAERDEARAGYDSLLRQNGDNAARADRYRKAIEVHRDKIRKHNRDFECTDDRELWAVLDDQGEQG